MSFGEDRQDRARGQDEGLPMSGVGCVSVSELGQGGPGLLLRGAVASPRVARVGRTFFSLA